MLTLITTAFYCGKPKYDEGDQALAYQREILHNRAFLVDTLASPLIFGFGAYCGSSTVAYVAAGALGGFQLFPLGVYLAISHLAKREGKAKENLLVRFRPDSKTGLGTCPSPPAQVKP